MNEILAQWYSLRLMNLEFGSGTERKGNNQYAAEIGFFLVWIPPYGRQNENDGTNTVVNEPKKRKMMEIQQNIIRKGKSE